MTVESMLGGGFGLLRHHPRAVAMWTGLYLLFAIAGYFAFRPVLGPLLEMQQNMMAAQASGESVPPVLPAFPGSFFAALAFVYVGLALIMAMIFAAAVRTVASGEDGTLGNLRFGWDELRLIGLGLIIAIGLWIAMFVVTIIAVVAIAAISVASPLLAVLVAIPIFIILFCAAIYVQVRLSLAGAMTVLQHRIVLTEAWRATRGRFWTLFAAYFVLGLIMIALWIAIVALTTPWLFSSMGSPEALQAASQAQIETQLESGITPMLVVNWLLGSLVMTGMMALMSGAVTTAALSLEPKA